jgi:hypothetical protein
VLADARVDVGDALGDEDDDVVGVEQVRRRDPPLQRHEVVAVVGRHVADLAGRDDRLDEVDHDGHLLPEEQEPLDHGQRARGVARKARELLLRHQRIADPDLRDERPLGLARLVASERDALAAVVADDVLRSEQLAPQEVYEADVLAARAHEVVHVAVQQEVARLAREIPPGDLGRPRGQPLDLVFREDSGCG